MESAALLDVFLSMNLVEPDKHGAGKVLIARVVSMLVMLIRKCE